MDVQRVGNSLCRHHKKASPSTESLRRESMGVAKSN
jgi:hypothetical protein